MLNRRSLRIKVMQFLYALERQKEAYELLAREKSCDHFTPDFNTLEEKDPDTISKAKKETGRAFDENFKEGNRNFSQYSPDIKEALTDGFLHYDNLVGDAQKLVYDTLIKEADIVADSYVKILILPVFWKNLVVGEWNKSVGEGKSLGSGYRNLASNPLIRAIEENSEISVSIKKKKIGWDTDTASDWMRKVVRKDESYQQYVENPKPTLDDHISVINNLFKKIIFKNDLINGYMEEHDLAWTENRSILKSMIIKTIKTYSDDAQSIQLINLSPNWKEDKEFFKKLYLETVKGNEKLEKVIAGKSQNWDVERIAAIDMVIMKMAITEFTEFPSIPVKVTINEYIEICKLYSTPKSKQYVNGILDVLSNELVDDGTIKKSGRGLLDNK